MTLNPTDLVGSYRIIRELGHGGMGSVYEAFHVMTGDRRAIKVFSLDHGNREFLRKRFLAEAKILEGYRVQIRSLLLRPDEIRTLETVIDAETSASYGIQCMEQPSVSGVLENRAGVLMLKYQLRCTPSLECDRCLSPVALPVEEEFFHIIVTEAASERNDAEYLLAPDAMLNLAEVVMTDLRLSMPSKTLCSPDCKGLCPSCGQNLNERLCGCESADVTLSYQ